MAITEQAYSELYPSNNKQVTIDMVSRIPAGADGDEKYVITVSTSAYSDVSSRTTISPVYTASLIRGWAQSHDISSPISIDNGSIQISIDEADSGAVSITLASGSWSGNALAQELEMNLRATASGSGVKVDSSNRLSYAGAKVKYENSRITILSGTSKKEFYSPNWSEVSSVKVTGGTLKNDLGFSTGYLNSYDRAMTASGYYDGPPSAHRTIDEVVRLALETIVNQIDFSG